MRWNDLYVAGTGVCIPPSVTVEAAIAMGRYDTDGAARSQHLSVTTAPANHRAPDFAVTAGLQALKRSGHTPDEIGILLHAVVIHAGIDAWNAASYVQQGVGAGTCLATEVRSGCNGALVGLELACSHLAARPKETAALVTAADIFPEPLIDRWRTAPGCIFGDGGAAAVVSGTAGFARIVAICTATDPALEALVSRV